MVVPQQPPTPLTFQQSRFTSLMVYIQSPESGLCFFEVPDSVHLLPSSDRKFLVNAPTSHVLPLWLTATVSVAVPCATIGCGFLVISGSPSPFSGSGAPSSKHPPSQYSTPPLRKDSLLWHCGHFQFPTANCV